MRPAKTTWKEWVGNCQRVKQAADSASEVKDPTDKGTPSIPSHPEGDNRSALQMPTNQSNSNEPGTMPTNILDVTKPNGVGQGEYITPENGTAKDEAFTSPTDPLSKIAQSLDLGLAELRKVAAPAASAEEVQPEKVASQEPAQGFEMPANLNVEPDLLHKLASFGAVMVGTTEGQLALEKQLKKAAGVAEAHALIAQVQEEAYKEAAALAAEGMGKQANAEASAVSAAAQPQYTQEEMQKLAYVQSTHEQAMARLATDLEKAAYAQGAQDAEAMAASMQDGGAPTIPGADELSEEDMMQVLSELVESGQIDPAVVEQMLAELNADGPGASLEEIAATIQAAVESGELDPAQAEAIVQAILASDPEAAAMVEGGAEPEAPEAPAEEAPIDKAASVLAELFAPAK